MKKIIIILFLSITAIFAQESKTLFVGPFISESAGMNIVTSPEGRKSGLAISEVPNFGLTVVAPLNRGTDFSFVLDLAYSNQPFQIKNASTGEKFNHQISYIAISPYLNFEGLLFGFNFGFPQSANNGSKIDVGIIKTLTEVKFGGNFNLFSDESGTVNASVLVSMMLNETYNSFELNDPLKDKMPKPFVLKVTDEYNPRIASLTFSINYLFNTGVTVLK
ncbi:MAG: hypothetical protein NTW25_08700 [Candidatus Kapabacteria bacterium]|nr:hypothetical protein [Candidatus Kapabacteria bacterium]